MTPETTKRFNAITGTTFALIGMLCFAVAAYVASVPAVPKPAPVSGRPIISAASCRDALNTMGYIATLSSGGGVSAKDGSLEDPLAALTKATAAISICKMKMTEFCMGNACSDPGVTFALATSAPADGPAVGAAAQNVAPSAGVVPASTTPTKKAK